MKSYELPIRGAVIFALQKLAEIQRPGESGAGGPRVTPTTVAAEILEVAVIERFEKAFGHTVKKGMELAGTNKPVVVMGDAGSGANVNRPCRVPLPFRSQADGHFDGGPEAA